MSEYNYVAGQRVGIKMWTGNMEVEASALQQLQNITSLPFIHHHVAAMPDVHWGMGATVGSVIATRGAIVPAAVGVDIGCGMMAVRLQLKDNELPDNLHAMRTAIEAAVPHGRTNNGGAGDRGAWGNVAEDILVAYNIDLKAEYDRIVAKHPGAKSFNGMNHLSTLGTGNHFIEVCVDEEGYVWLMLHSGSRGPGNKIGQYFIEKAKIEMDRYFIGEFLPDRDLSYLVEYTEIHDDYVDAVHWAQKFALVNRELMMRRVWESVENVMGRNIKALEQAVNCHHNYVAKEHHFGVNVWVTRKGAVRARKGDLGIIPGSMGTGSFIVRGKGNKDSFCSCSHGAGRRMSRGEAKRVITLEEHAQAMAGIEARLDADVLDESPAAYKDIGQVMVAQDGLVEIVHRLHQVVNVKG